MGIFVAYPWLALAPAIIFGCLYYVIKNKFLAVIAGAWILYAIYEELNLLRITCSGECDIRIDLLFIYPFLFVITLIGLVVVIQSIRKVNKS